MNRTPDFDDHLADLLEEGPTAAPDHVLDTVLAAFPSIPQRRVALRAPWRSQLMTGYVRLLAGIAAVAAIAVGGLVFLNTSPSANVGRPPAASPSPSVRPSPATSSASPAATRFDTSGWKPFTSTRHGVTLRYPADWTVTAATAPWPAGTDPADLPSPMLDTFASPDGVTFVIVSQPLPNGLSGDAWLARREATNAARFPTSAECWPAPANMERTVVDGLLARLHGGCGSNEAIAFAGGRVYLIIGYTDPTLNRRLFDAFLSTVTFDPTKADDTPVAPPSSSPGPSPSPS
jgi:hypothetical protein